MTTFVPMADMSPGQVDVSLFNEGSIVLFQLNTEAAREWVSEHVDPAATWFGNSLVVDHRYVDDLVDGMLDAGLELI